MNHYEKYLGKEDLLHVAVCRYLTMQHPNVLWMHPANEGKRTNFERFKAKKLGLKPGFPDIMIFERRRLWCGLFIELKIAPNKTTKFQDEVMSKLVAKGWMGKVCYNFDETKILIDEYLKQ